MADSKHTLTIQLEEIDSPQKDDPRSGGGVESQPVSSFGEQMKELHSRAKEIQSSSQEEVSYQQAFQQAVQPQQEPILPTSEEPPLPVSQSDTSEELPPPVPLGITEELPSPVPSAIPLEITEEPPLPIPSPVPLETTEELPFPVPLGITEDDIPKDLMVKTPPDILQGDIATESPLEGELIFPEDVTPPDSREVILDFWHRIFEAMGDKFSETTPTEKTPALLSGPTLDDAPTEHLTIPTSLDDPIDEEKPKLHRKADITDIIPESGRDDGIGHILKTMSNFLTAPFRIAQHRAAGGKGSKATGGSSQTTGPPSTRMFGGNRHADWDGGGGGGGFGGFGGGGCEPVGGAGGGDATKVVSGVFIDAIESAAGKLVKFADFLDSATEEIAMFSPEIIGEQVETQLELLRARIGRANSGESGALAGWEESKRGLLVSFEETKSILVTIIAPLMTLLAEILGFILDIINVFLRAISSILGGMRKTLYYILYGLDFLVLGAIPNEWIESIDKAANGMLGIMSQDEDGPDPFARMVKFLQNPAQTVQFGLNLDRIPANLQVP